MAKLNMKQVADRYEMSMKDFIKLVDVGAFPKADQTPAGPRWDSDTLDALESFGSKVQSPLAGWVDDGQFLKQILADLFGLGADASWDDVTGLTINYLEEAAKHVKPLDFVANK